MSQTNFFATHRDLLELLKQFELEQDIHYAEAGVFDNDRALVYLTAESIPGLGEIDAPNPQQGRILLIADVTLDFRTRAVPQRRGGVRYAVDQRENPDTISLRPGGQFKHGMVVAGDFATCTDSATSLALMDLIAQMVKRKWTRIKSYAVGPEAEKVLDAGGRLTAGLRPEYDLQR